MHRENGLPVVKVLSAYNSWKLEHYKKRAGAAVRLLYSIILHLHESERITDPNRHKDTSRSEYFCKMFPCIHPSRRGQGRKDSSAYSLKSVAFLRLTCLINGQPEPFRLLYFMMRMICYILPGPPQAWNDTTEPGGWHVRQTLTGHNRSFVRAETRTRVHALCTQKCWLGAEYRWVQSEVEGGAPKHNSS